LDVATILFRDGRKSVSRRTGGGKRLEVKTWYRKRKGVAPPEQLRGKKRDTINFLMPKREKGMTRNLTGLSGVSARSCCVLREGRERNRGPFLEKAE